MQKQPAKQNAKASVIIQPLLIFPNRYRYITKLKSVTSELVLHLEHALEITRKVSILKIFTA